MAVMPARCHRAVGIEQRRHEIDLVWVITLESLHCVVDNEDPERTVLEAKLSLAFQKVKQTVEYPIK